MQRGNAPEIADAEGVGLCIGQRGVVEIVVMVVQPFAEVFVIGAAIRFEEQRTCLGHFDAANGFLIGQTFR